MNFEQIYNDGAVAYSAGKSMLDNPFYRPENLPMETATAYRAWQIKAEAWEQGWRALDTKLATQAAKLRNHHHPLCSPVAFTATSE